IRERAFFGPEHLERFRTEAEALARLQHPNIVQIHEIGEHQGRPYYSLEFVEGGSLDRRLRGSPVPPRQSAQIVETLTRAIHAAQECGVVRRDLKPANVLVGKQWLLKITDFGLAKRMDDDVGQTRDGAVLGTPSYMAPEQAAGRVQEVGPAADVYALGAILYECLTGRPPIPADTWNQALQQALLDEPTPPTRLVAYLPRHLAAVRVNCLYNEPGRPY